MGNKEKTTLQKWFWPGIILTGIIVSFWLASGYFLFDYKDKGTFGDSFGAINALFSGLALAGIIIAIFLQSEELKLQRKELADTREEIEGQRIALEGQNSELSLQRFESTFFNLLRTQQEITNEIYTLKGNQKVRGRLFFTLAASELAEIYLILNRSSFAGLEYQQIAITDKFRLDREKWNVIRKLLSAEDNDKHDSILIKEAYKVLYNLYHFNIGHYFRNLYHILKYVDDKRVTELTPVYSEMPFNPDKENAIWNRYKRYAESIQAQMSSAELTLLFYNGLNFPKMHKLLEQYGLLVNLAQEDLILQCHTSFYPKTNFKSRNE